MIWAFRVVLLGVLLLFSGSAGAFVWPNAADEVAEGLRSDDIAERRRAAVKIAELPTGMAAPLILVAIDDVDADVRLTAARAAAELRVAEAGERVIDWLADSDVRFRLAACEVLRTSPTVRALSSLGRALGDGNQEVRVAVAVALGLLGSPDAIASLLGHLDDPSIEVRVAIVTALGRIGDDSAVIPLLGRVQDNSIDVRRTTVRVLGDLGSRRASSALLLALQDRSDDVRVEAVESLGRLRETDAINAIASLIQTGASTRLRDASSEALGVMGGEDVVGPLLLALQNDDPSSESSAARRALVKQGPSVAPRLVATVLKSQSANVVSGCILVLGEIGGEDHVSFINEMMQQGKVAETIGLRSMAKLRRASVLPYVLELLDAPSSAVRMAAIDAAAEILDSSKKDGLSVDPIAVRLADPGLAVAERVALARLLGRTGSRRALGPLVPMVRTADDSVRLAAIAALGEIGPVSQDAVLLDAMSDRNPSVRMAAAIALSRVSAPETALVLYRKLMLGVGQDRTALGIAFSGALARSNDEDLLRNMVRKSGSVGYAVRDVFIEGLGRARSPVAGRLLAGLAQSEIPEDRRKAAEALAGHPQQVSVLRQLLSDRDSSVRANAVWSLGRVGIASDKASVASMVEERDVVLASNAVGALSVLGERGVVDVTELLCSALSDDRPYVRANAIAGLRATAKRCQSGVVERTILGTDQSSVVRMRAAELLRDVPSLEPLADERALRMCLLNDRSGDVASACRGLPMRKRGTVDRLKNVNDPVLVFVVPDGAVLPQPRASFSLVFEDGRMRSGTADRRGAVFEGMAPRGQVNLAIPAPQVLSGRY